MFIDCLGFLATLDRDLISKTREILRNLMNDELISNLIHDKISKIESTYLKVIEYEIFLGNIMQFIGLDTRRELYTCE